MGNFTNSVDPNKLPEKKYIFNYQPLKKVQLPNIITKYQITKHYGINMHVRVPKNTKDSFFTSWVIFRSLVC